MRTHGDWSFDFWLKAPYLHGKGAHVQLQITEYCGGPTKHYSVRIEVQGNAALDLSAKNLSQAELTEVQGNTFSSAVMTATGFGMRAEVLPPNPPDD